MAKLVKCTACKHKISKDADTCPKCGHPNNAGAKTKSKKGLTLWKLIKYSATGFFLLYAFMFIKSYNDPATQKQMKASLAAERQARAAQTKLEASPEFQRQQQINSYFSEWNGSHKFLTKVVKGSMHDPKSFDHVNTSYVDKKDHLIITMIYRGKNAFGGTVTNSIKARHNLKDNKVTIIE